MWKQHDNYMKQLKQLYNKTSKQTQNRLQEIFDTFNFIKVIFKVNIQQKSVNYILK